MSSATLVLLLLAAMWLSYAVRAGFAYSRALRNRGQKGLLGFDREASRRYAGKPLSFVTEGALTAAFRLALRRQDDPVLERLRKTYLFSVIGTVVSSIFVWMLW
jgi:hypothetical protein